MLSAAKVDLVKAVNKLLSEATDEVKENINNVLFALGIRSAVFLKLNPKKTASVPENFGTYIMNIW